MADFKIKKGYTVPIKGSAKPEIVDGPHLPFVGISPTDFKGVKPRLKVKVDDNVKVGSPLFIDKKNPDVVFASPASGRITAINYGPRRVIEEILIATDETPAHIEHDRFDLAGISKTSRDQMIAHLMNGGLWPYIRSRPFEKIATEEQSPKAIFINCMDTAPLANDPNVSLKDMDQHFAAGVAAMRVLCDMVHIAVRHEQPHAGFVSVQGAQVHTFSGKHPTGLVGTHINKIDPLNKGEVVWYIHARDLVMIGQFLLDGKYPIRRVVALAGTGVQNPRYIKTQIGVKIKDLVTGELAEGEQRFISGNPLSGTARAAETLLGFYDDLITVIPEGREQYFLGWLKPGLNVPSYGRTFLSGFMPGKKFAMDTNIHGGHRAIIQSGLYEHVVALDLHPEFLVKATLAEDIDAMEQLGILECAPEDFALCTYICPSKTEVSKIISDGLDLMEKEG